MNTQNRYIDKISNDETAQLPAIEFGGEIRVVDNERDIEEACRHLAAQPVVGFDTETRPSFRAGVTFRVSLLQLSSKERCYLFRLNRIPLAKPLLQLLEDEKVLKIGADVGGDLHALWQLRHFRDSGFVDLQRIAPRWGIEEKSLRKLSAIVLGQRVSKAQRLSNWEAASLTDKQQLYAATDAWVCIRIYEQLLRTPQTAPSEAPLEEPAGTAEPKPADEKPAAKRKRSGRSRRRRTAEAAATQKGTTQAPAQEAPHEAARKQRPKASRAAQGETPAAKAAPQTRPATAEGPATKAAKPRHRAPRRRTPKKTTDA